MTNKRQVATYELNSFLTSPFMRQLHTVPAGTDLETNIMSEVTQVSWVSHQNDVIQANVIGTDDVIGTGNGDLGPVKINYHPSHEMDYLIYVYLTTKTPYVAVDPKFRGRVRICWPLNLFHQLITTAVVTFGTSNGPTIPQGWLDHQMGWFMKQGIGQEGNYNRMIGNIQSLVKWSDIIEPRSIACPQPWWFSESYNKAVPLFKCKDRMSFTYTYNLRVVDLLRVELFSEENQRWEAVSNPSDKTKFLSNVNENTRFSNPIMRGRYGVLDSPERSWKLEIDQSVLATSIVRKVASNTVRAGTNTTIDLNLPTPIYAMFFRARHVEASRIGDFSNYTTNPHDRFAGDDPIISVTHIYNTDEVEMQDLSDLSAIQGWYNTPSCPREPGYGMYAKSGRPTQNVPDTGMLYNKDLAGSVRFGLASSRLRNSDDHDDAEKVFQQYTKSRQASSSETSFDSYEVALYLQTAYIIIYHKDGRVEIDDGHLSERNWSLSHRLNDGEHRNRSVASNSSLN